eukprot:Nk52_evm3s314 gene=Nk52_evmTU3s314
MSRHPHHHMLSEYGALEEVPVVLRRNKLPTLVNLPPGLGEKYSSRGGTEALAGKRDVVTGRVNSASRNSGEDGNKTGMEKYDYDFGYERSVVQLLEELQAKDEARKAEEAKIDQRVEDKKRKKREEEIRLKIEANKPPPVIANISDTILEPIKPAAVPQNSKGSDNGENKEDTALESGEPAVILSASGVNNNSSSSNSNSKNGCAKKPAVSNFMLSDFEESDNPFDNSELASINDIDELSSVLGGGTYRPAATTSAAALSTAGDSSRRKSAGVVESSLSSNGVTSEALIHIGPDPAQPPPKPDTGDGAAMGGAVTESSNNGGGLGNNTRDNGAPMIFYKQGSAGSQSLPDIPSIGVGAGTMPSSSAVGGMVVGGTGAAMGLQGSGVFSSNFPTSSSSSPSYAVPQRPAVSTGSGVMGYGEQMLNQRDTKAKNHPPLPAKPQALMEEAKSDAKNKSAPPMRPPKPDHMNGGGGDGVLPENVSIALLPPADSSLPESVYRALSPSQLDAQVGNRATYGMESASSPSSLVTSGTKFATDETSFFRHIDAPSASSNNSNFSGLESTAAHSLPPVTPPKPISMQPGGGSISASNSPIGSPPYAFQSTGMRTGNENAVSPSNHRRPPPPLPKQPSSSVMSGDNVSSNGEIYPSQTGSGYNMNPNGGHNSVHDATSAANLNGSSAHQVNNIIDNMGASIYAAHPPPQHSVVSSLSSSMPLSSSSTTMTTPSTTTTPTYARDRPVIPPKRPPPVIPKRPAVEGARLKEGSPLKEFVTMGFPLDRVLNADKVYQGDQRRILDYLVEYTALEELGFDRVHIEEALVEFDLKHDECVKYLECFSQLVEFGFPNEKIKTALKESKNDRDQALEYLFEHEK